MLNLGDFPVGATVYVPINTFSAAGASVTITGLAVTDIEIYKNGGTTQRASDNGYTLLDTDGIDFDGVTGVHGFSIDLADNSTASFFTAGADYWVVVNAITCDSQTLTFVAAIFSIENRRAAGELVRTTIATLASQTSFTLTAGSADDSAYVGCTVVVSDIASGVQKAVGVVSAYTGSSKTVTLAADPAIFTMAAGDNVSVLATSARANVVQLASVLSGVTALERAARCITIGTVGSSSTTTSVISSSMTPAAAVTDQFKGLILAFDKDTTTANLRGQKTDITASTSGGVLTCTALTTAPASGDTFSVQ